MISASDFSFLLFADELNTFGRNSLALTSSMASETCRLSKNSKLASKLSLDGGGGVGVRIARILSAYDDDGLWGFLEFEDLLLDPLLLLDELEELDEDRLRCLLRCDIDGDRESRRFWRLYFDVDL